MKARLRGSPQADKAAGEAVEFAPLPEDLRIFAGTVAQQRNAALDRVATLEVEIVKLQWQLEQERRRNAVKPPESKAPDA